MLDRYHKLVAAMQARWLQQYAERQLIKATLQQDQAQGGTSRT